MLKHGALVVASASLFVSVAGSGCDPFGIWNTTPIEGDVELEPIKLVVQSPAPGLDGLIDYARADGSRCEDTEDGCVHVGAIREVRIGSRDSCAGLTLRDALDVFAWTCADVDDGQGIVARGTLRADRGLAEIIDFEALTLRTNQLELVEQREGGDGDVVGRSSPAQWWSTVVLEAPPATNGTAVLDEPNSVYVVGGDTGPVTVDGAHIAVVVRPGEELAANGAGGNGPDSTAITASDSAFVWIEGALTGTDESIEARDAAWLLVRRARLRSEAAGAEGLFVIARNLTIVDVGVLGGEVGLRISDSQNVQLERVRAFGGGSFLISSTTDLVAHDIVMGSMDSSAIYLDGGARQRWRGLVMAGQAYGVSGGNGATDISFHDVTSVGTDVAVIDVDSVTRFEVAGLLSVNDLITIRINDATSSELRFADLAVIGAGGAPAALPSRVFSFPEGRPATTSFEGALLMGAGVDCQYEVATCAGFGFATLESAPDASALVGEVADDATETADVGGRASFASISDGTRFDVDTRAWTKPGALTGGEAARGACVSDCQILDVALRANSALLGALAIESLRETLGPGGESATTRYLERAREIDGDGDALCEAGEVCAAAVDFGAYQGHGGLREPLPTTIAGEVFRLADAAQNGF